MSGAKDMFSGDSRMLGVFGAFASKLKPLTFEESLGFVKKVKARDYTLYSSLFDILGKMELSELEAYQELQLLFQNHHDLQMELERFRPPAPPKRSVYTMWPWVFMCAAPFIALSLLPVIGDSVAWPVQQTFGKL